MPGVTLSEESGRILATNSELVGAVTHSCKKETFLSSSILKKRMLEIGRRHGMAELAGDVVNFVSHATQHHLQNLLEKVTQVAQHKNFNFQEDSTYDLGSNVHAELQVFKQLDQLEKQRKGQQERELLLMAAKSQAWQEDPKQLCPEQKAKEQLELAQLRRRKADLVAQVAICPWKKRKVLGSTSSGAEGWGSSPSVSSGAGPSSSRDTRQRITCVNLRDLLFCLDNERSIRRSHLLYKGFLKLK